ncbi:MAG: permease [Spirulinaceae cyanobacterium]
MYQLYSAFTLFLSLLVEAMPFLLLGVLFSSGLLLFIDERQLVSRLPKNPFLGSLIGSLIGFLFPVCECGNVPVARRLLIQGTPSAVACSFLLAAPTINPIVIWSTWVAFQDQPELVWLRVLFSLTIATIIGCVFGYQADAKPLLQPALARRIYSIDTSTSPDTPSLLKSGTYLLGNSGKTQSLASEAYQQFRKFKKSKPRSAKTSPKKLDLFLNNTIQELRELGGMLIVGSAIAACIQVFVPREIILNLGQGSISSILAMMLLAALVSICSTVDAFFALSFATTFTSASLLAFLVFGPMIDLKSVGLLLSVFKPKIVTYLFILAAQLTFILCLGYAYFF